MYIYIFLFYQNNTMQVFIESSFKVSKQFIISILIHFFEMAHRFIKIMGCALQFKLKIFDFFFYIQDENKNIYK